MLEKKSSGLFDKNTIIALALTALFFIGWQKYQASKYPQLTKKEATVTVPGETETNTISKEAPDKIEVVKSPKPLMLKEEKKFQFNDENISFTISSQGMGLSDVSLTAFKDNENNPIRIGQGEEKKLFQMTMNKTKLPVVFDLQEKEKGVFVGEAIIGSTKIIRELKYYSEKKAFENTILVKDAEESFAEGFSLEIPEKIQQESKKSFFFPSYEMQDFFTMNEGKSETVNFNKANENIAKEFTTVSLVAVSSQYFAASLLDQSEWLPSIKMSSDINAQSALAEVIYKPIKLKDEMKFSQTLYVGPKSIDRLVSINEAMANIINFGYFGFIAKPLLYTMKLFQSFVQNWGVSIILLTLLVRLLVLPFNIMSTRSMKAMQKIQPAIAILREKYKQDAVTLNREMMLLMKQSGANPLGGCLPMLLQIPIFFALYQVIGSSVELYHSPFILWITDLSSHDQYYVLPVLMGITMFLQQKMTPTTMDPVQAKILSFMPILFSFLMIQLPSGLTLYMFVSGLFGIIQQYVMLRETKAQN